MSHPHAGDGANAPAAGQSQTLFISEPLGLPARIVGVLVSSADGQQRQRRMTFRDPHAALDWCLAHHAGLVMTRAEDPARN